MQYFWLVNSTWLLFQGTFSTYWHLTDRRLLSCKVLLLNKKKLSLAWCYKRAHMKLSRSSMAISPSMVLKCSARYVDDEDHKALTNTCLSLSRATSWMLWMSFTLVLFTNSWTTMKSSANTLHWTPGSPMCQSCQLLHQLLKQSTSW